MIESTDSRRKVISWHFSLRRLAAIRICRTGISWNGLSAGARKCPGILSRGSNLAWLGGGYRFCGREWRIVHEAIRVSVFRIRDH